MAFSEISRGTPENFEEQTRDHHVLNSMLAAIAGDRRFSPDHFYDDAPSKPTPSTRTFNFSNETGSKPRNTQWSAIPEAVPASTGMYWVGFAVFVLVIWGVLAILMK